LKKPPLDGAAGFDVHETEVLNVNAT